MKDTPLAQELLELKLEASKRPSRAASCNTLPNIDVYRQQLPTVIIARAIRRLRHNHVNYNCSRSIVTACSSTARR